MASSAAVPKLKKAGDKAPTAFEVEVATALSQIETSAGAIRAELKPLHIVGAREIAVGDSGAKAMVVFVPYNQLNEYRKVHRILVEELEKKFADHQVVLIAQRTVLPKSSRDPRKAKEVRSTTRTLTAVHEAVLDDLVYPADIVGKRVRYFLDGSKLLKVHLSARDRVLLEAKLPAFASVYGVLTNKKVAFEFA